MTYVTEIIISVVCIGMGLPIAILAYHNNNRLVVSDYHNKIDLKLYVSSVIMVSAIGVTIFGSVGLLMSGLQELRIMFGS